MTACGGPTGTCPVQVTAIYDAAPIARLGNGSVWASLEHAAFTEVRGPGGASLRASDLVAGGSTAYGTGVVCALAPTREVWCVPLPGPLLDSTPLGAGDDFTVVTEGAVRVVTADVAPRPPLRGARQLASTMNGLGPAFCAVTDAGEILCWGSSDNGLLGRGNGDRSPFARAVLADAQAPFTDAAEVRLGLDSACARKRDGSVWCWGDNSVGQAGFAFQDTTGVPFPVRVQLPARATRLATSPGRTHCALLEDDRVACWGWNADGQAGAQLSPAGQLPVPNQAAPPTIVLSAAGGPPLTALVDLAPDRGMRAMCGRLADGRVVCWGRPFPRAGQPDTASPFPIETAARTHLPLGAFGERDGALVYVDDVTGGLVTFGAGNQPLTTQPRCAAP